MEFDPKQFDKIVDRTQTWSVKWDSDYMIERFDRTDLLPFNHAEMDFECAQPIIDAVKERANHGIYGYTLVKAEYYDEIIKWFRNRHNIEYSREDLIYSTGVITAYRQVVDFFTKPNDNILLLTPIYKPLSLAVKEYQRNLVTVPLTLENNKYFIDFDLLEKEMSELKSLNFDLGELGFNQEELNKCFGNVDFLPVDESEQPRLDKFNPIICPHCGKEIER